MKLNICAVIIFIFLLQSLSAKTIYYSANQAPLKIDTKALDPGQDLKSGITLDLTATPTDGVIRFYIQNKKLKNVTVYGDPKDGSIEVLLLKGNLKDGAVTDTSGNLLSKDAETLIRQTFQPTESQITIDLPSNLKKKKNEMWAINIDLEKGTASPEVYGIKIKV